MLIALVGQPNSGKSTLFNALAGYRAVSSNFPGTTVELLRGKALIAGRPAEIVDLPGAYSLLAGDRAEQVTRDFLVRERVDVVVNVIDASLLGRSLELTLELAELGLPLVVCLNMMDEAKRKGIQIFPEKLEELLGVPVVTTIASRGIGLSRLTKAISRAKPARPPRYSADVEKAIAKIEELISPAAEGAVPRRYIAIQLLAGERLPQLAPETLAEVERVRSRLAKLRGDDPALVLSSERHAAALNLFEQVAVVGHAQVDFREKLDQVLMHPVFGYPLLLLVLLGMFWVVFKVGGMLEEALIPPLEGLTESLETALGGGVGAHVLVGAFQGLWAGLAIALPYLVPFLLILALLEDSGYLPRVGYLLDTLMHRMGLHGKSVIPFLLGYGCSVPAVLATRILEDERDRLITAALAVMVPCAGRAIVIFGLVGQYVGPLWAFGLYLLNIAVIVAAGWILKRLLPGTGPGLILEIPPYRLPSLRTLLGKTWLRLKEFVVIAWPLLVVTSAIFALIEALGWAQALNSGVRFITWPLGLPPQTGVPLVFGILRKELSLLMLAQAFGTAQFSQVLTPAQMVVFTGFVLFYMPCLATVAALGRELGWKRAGIVLLGTTGLALLVGVILRGFLSLA